MGRLAHEKSENGLLMRFCLNINPLQSLYCMAKVRALAFSSACFVSFGSACTLHYSFVLNDLHTDDVCMFFRPMYSQHPQTHTSAH